MGVFPENQEHKPTFKNILNGKPCYAQMYLRHYKLDDIPSDTDEQCSEWLLNLYREKDEIYENCIENNGFTIGTEFPLKPRPHSLIIMLTWIILITAASLNFFYSIIFHGSIYSRCGIVLFFILFYIFAKLMIGVTETGKGSSYGSSPKHKANKLSDNVSEVKEETTSENLNKKED